MECGVWGVECGAVAFQTATYWKTRSGALQLIKYEATSVHKNTYLSAVLVARIAAGHTVWLPLSGGRCSQGQGLAGADWLAS